MPGAAAAGAGRSEEGDDSGVRPVGMSEPVPPALPPWAREVIDLYESGACSQFILHGNVSDRLLVPSPGAGVRIGSLDEFLKEVLLARFEVVISYDLGNGTRVEKGGGRFAEWPAWKEKPLPTAPREAIHVLTHYLRFCANLGAPETRARARASRSLSGMPGLIVPPGAGGANYELSAIASQLREWAVDPSIADQHCATFLVTENLNDLHPLVAQNPQAMRASCSRCPAKTELEPALVHLSARYPTPLKPFSSKLSEPAAALAGATLHSIETLMQTREHHKKEVTGNDLVALKKQLVEQGCPGAHRIRQVRSHAR